MNLSENEILVLRDCGPNGESKNGMIWPERGVVTCHDWMDNDLCGNGFHGLPWGEGGDYRRNNGASWRVVKVDTSPGNYRHGTGDMVDKCKFRTGELVYAGNVQGATDLIMEHAPPGTRCNWCTLTGGNECTLTGGN
jgi:hypothetical protein